MGERYITQIDKFVGIEKPPTLAITAFDAAEYSATRVQWEHSDDGHPVNFDRSDGYLLCVQRKAVPLQPYWVDGVGLSLRPMEAGQFLFLDLNQQHASVVPTRVDCLSIYTSREVVARFHAEHSVRGSAYLEARIGSIYNDRVVRHLGESLLPALESPEETSALYVDHVALALLSRITILFGSGSHVELVARGRLAPWQERRAKEMLLAHFDGRIGLDELATECRLSRSHFARAFKATTGQSPLAWLMSQRIQRAQALLEHSNMTSEQIAFACGFSDASHFSRSFQRTTGYAPGTWRRIRKS